MAKTPKDKTGKDVPRLTVVAPHDQPDTTQQPDQATAQPSRGPTDPVTGLTPKQEAFCQAMAREGLNQSDAYRKAYDTTGMADGTIWTQASILRKNQKVADRIADIVAEIRAEDSASRATRAARVVATLEQMMLTAKTDSGRLRAAELLGKTVGLYRDVVEDGTQSADDVQALQAELDRILSRNKDIA